MERATEHQRQVTTFNNSAFPTTKVKPRKFHDGSGLRGKSGDHVPPLHADSTSSFNSSRFAGR